MLLCVALLAGCDGSSDDSRGSGPTPADPLSLQLTVEGEGQVSSSPRTRDCFASCTLDFAAGTLPTLLAVPARGGRFAGWDGACADSTTTVCTLSTSGSLQATARFEPVPAQAADWYEGDLHTHSDHSSDGSLPRQTLDDRAPGNMPISDILRLAGNLGADFLPITDHRTYDQHYDPQWTSDRVLLIPGEEANGRPHATVHGAVDMIDQNAALEGAPESRVVQESIWLAHSQGAAWVTAHPDRDSANDDGSPRPHADAVGVDLVEVWNRAENPEAEIDYAENRWNAGWRFGIAGASDNHFKELWALGGTPLRPATATLTPMLNERAVLDSLRGGSTIVYSNGPTTPRVTLDADFDGDGTFEALAGQEVLVPAGIRGRLRARVEAGLGSRLLIYAAPGRSAGPIANIALAGAPGGDTHLIDVVTPQEPTWYRAELRSIGLAEPASLLTGLLLGPYEIENLFQELLSQLRAATSPIFVSAASVEPVGEFVPPPDAGRDDGAEYALGAPGEFAGFPDAAFDAAAGRLHLVAEVHDPLATRVQYLARSADGRWSAPQTLSDSTSARFPKVAAHDGRIVVAWQDERAGQIPRRPAIWLRVSEDGGLSFGPEIPVRGSDGRAMHPDLALAADGAAHLVWQEITSGAPFDVWYTTVGADGVVAEAVNLSRADKDIDAGSPLDARSARYPASVWPAIALDGATPVVAWQDNRSDLDPLWTGGVGYGEGTSPDDWQIAVMRLGRDETPVFLGAADTADRHPDLIVDAAGRTHVVWDSKPLRSSGANLRLLATARQPATHDFIEPQSVAEEAAASAHRPRLGLDAAGVPRLSWFDSRSADWRWRVMHAAYDGAQWGAASLLDSRGINTWPVPAGPYTVLASTRNARRLQRDRSQQIFVVDSAQPATRAATVAAAALPKTLRLAAPVEQDEDCLHIPIPVAPPAILP
ncbi:CehA/McbA family metallohydrolase [Algiphilus sp. W345]|uniref:CehA/McbA family metallohydrolase n=1 Tax=Banduia mediterranea TaxID=3075609 RepID=A0ABU2WGM7_9GAMM|nr:CehA/McbA family metallohydrolase [Algiphilus sp. W345]MDT0496426.1 CehA/McbA family metallohydrolase [Algiphilus sp. W345]